MPNVYYSPEKCGLDVVGRLDQPDMSYEFHMLCVWKNKESEKILWAEDSGCSCPAPFEDYYYDSKDNHNLNTSVEALCEAIDSFPSSKEEKTMLIESLAKLNFKLPPVD